MRTDDRVYLVKQGKSEYDPIAGEVVEQPADKKLVACHVSDLGLEKSVEIFGDHETDRKVVRFISRPDIDFDYIEYQNDKYNLLNKRLSGTVYYIGRDSVG